MFGPGFATIVIFTKSQRNEFPELPLKTRIGIIASELKGEQVHV